MKLGAGALALMVTIACGTPPHAIVDGNPVTVDGPAADAAADAAPCITGNGSHGLASVHVTRADGSPASGAQVAFYSLTCAATVVDTDVNGDAQADITDGAWITAGLRDATTGHTHLATWQGARPGDALVLGPSLRPHNSRGVLSISPPTGPLPAGAQAAVVFTPCSKTILAGGTTAEQFTDCAGATVSIVALAYDHVGVVGYTIARDEPATDHAVTLPPWQTDVRSTSVTLDPANLNPTGSIDLADGDAVDDQAYTFGLATYPPGLVAAITTSATLGTAGGLRNAARIVRSAALPARIDQTLADFLAVPTSLLIAPNGNAADIAVDADPSADIVLGTFSSGTADWSFAADPRRSSTLRVPPLPVELAGMMPVPPLEGFAAVVDTSEAVGYDDVRARAFDLSTSALCSGAGGPHPAALMCSGVGAWSANGFARLPFGTSATTDAVYRVVATYDAGGG